MAEQKKTYGVYGLTDYVAEIKSGKVTLKAHFTGGAMTSYGVTPASYSTSNEVIQRIIERSEQFKSGRIQLISGGESSRSTRITQSSRELQRVEMSSLPAAQEWLKDHYNVASSRSRSKEKAIEIGRELGVEIVFL